MWAEIYHNIFRYDAQLTFSMHMEGTIILLWGGINFEFSPSSHLDCCQIQYSQLLPFLRPAVGVFFSMLLFLYPVILDFKAPFLSIHEFPILSYSLQALALYRVARLDWQRFAQSELEPA